MGKVMYLYKNRLLPERFNDMFSLNSDLHKYSTRTKNAFHLPYCRSNIMIFSLCFQSPKLFSPPSTQPCSQDLYPGPGNEDLYPGPVNEDLYPSPGNEVIQVPLVLLC